MKGVLQNQRAGTGRVAATFTLSLEVEPSMEKVMLYWAVMFLVIALVAAVFGFGGIASTATGMAQILFVIALVLFVISLFAGLLRKNL